MEEMIVGYVSWRMIRLIMKLVVVPTEVRENCSLVIRNVRVVRDYWLQFKAMIKKSTGKMVLINVEGIKVNVTKSSFPVIVHPIVSFPCYVPVLYIFFLLFLISFSFSPRGFMQKRLIRGNHDKIVLF